MANAIYWQAKQLLIMTQYDLDELMGTRLQIGEQSQLFHNLIGQVLGLVYDQEDIFPLGFFLYEKGI